MRRINVPPHRFAPLKNDWLGICTPIVHNLKLQIRMNPRKMTVDIRVIIFTNIMILFIILTQNVFI